MQALKKFLNEAGHGSASLLAGMMDVNTSTITRWRDGVWTPIPKTRKKLLRFIAIAKKSFVRKP